LFSGLKAAIKAQCRYDSFDAKWRIVSSVTQQLGEYFFIEFNLAVADLVSGFWFVIHWFIV
jgi:hypothetical protein